MGGSVFSRFAFGGGSGSWDEESAWVRRQCPTCGRFLKEGDLKLTLMENLEACGWICSVHGEVQPEFGFGEAPVEEP
jgi:hypothetical protein